MPIRNKLNTYNTDQPRHWCPKSEVFTGVDSLIAALANGWTLNKRVFMHTKSGRSTALVIVYYFELRKDQDIVTMAVVNNPQIRHIIENYELEIITENRQATATV